MKIKHKKILIGVCIVFIFCGAGVSCYQIIKNYIDNTIQLHIEKLEDEISYIKDDIEDEIKDELENRIEDEVRDKVDDAKSEIENELDL